MANHVHTENEFIGLLSKNNIEESFPAVKCSNLAVRTNMLLKPTRNAIATYFTL